MNKILTFDKNFIAIVYIMDIDIFKNSYVIFVISFIVLCVIVYLFGIGQQMTIETVDDNGKQKAVLDEKFNWKYPLAISLLIWAFWHYYLYPVDDDIELSNNPPRQVGGNKLQQRYEHIQKINLANWY